MQEKKKKIIREKKEHGKKISGNREKELKIGIGIMICVILFVIFINFLIQRTKKFEYAGLEFVKNKKGNLVLYSTNFPVNDLSGKVVGYISFYFREDPRKLDGIDIYGFIQLRKKAALAINDNFVRSCEDSILAATTLSVFLDATDIEAFGATTNKTEAEKLDRRYVECGNNETFILRDYSIIEFKESDASSIMRNVNDCYTLNIANCEIMNVTERLMLGLYAHSRGIEI